MTAQTRRPDSATGAFLAGLAILALILSALAVRLGEERGAESGAEASEVSAPDGSRVVVPQFTRRPTPTPDENGVAVDATTDSRPRWRRERVLSDGRMLIAYYGTAGTGALGVLGERSIKVSHRRLLRAAEPFVRTGRDVVPVYELIVTVADSYPGKGRDYSHDISRSAVRTYVEAARRRGAMLVLDLQPGRDDFLTVAKRWAWALREPHVGLALDPEWRMGRHQVPARVIGSVRAREVNRVSLWLSRLVRKGDLPEKAFVLHQFRTSMLPDIDRIRDRAGLALIQHVDGFGTPGQKRATFHAVKHPKRFAMGFKLFYDEDVRLMDADAVHRIRPRVRFVSYQ